ncbi:GDCCVxC domain-containing (seleno)protein [Burkholderia pyrrocinia]|uniref:GDCCVxC domain-containing (seleno)protein n=1 Tax=Burkholderia pyrrocinia TaxID=60550 RepID=UPI002AAF118E|nr:GDCCVxC domain-containing (seleno)protein [Burkholderia pyrrocinia]
MTKAPTDSIDVRLASMLTCPLCGHAVELDMPTDACLFFYECEHCHTRLRPLPGDCCVFCSYGSTKCPPIQVTQCSCSA